MLTITVSGQSNKEAQKNPFLSPFSKQAVLDALTHNGFPGAGYTPGAGEDKFSIHNGTVPQLESLVEKALGPGYTVVAV